MTLTIAAWGLWCTGHDKERREGEEVERGG